MFNKRAFTMIEFAIAALVFAVVGGVAFFFLKSGYDARQLTTFENEVMSDQDRAVKAINDILDTALRIDGPSLTASQANGGQKPIVEVENQNPDFEELTVITNRHPHVMTRVQGLVQDGANYKFVFFNYPVPLANDSPEEVERKQAMIDMAQTVKNFMFKTPATTPVFFQSSADSNLFSITPPASVSDQVIVNIQPLLALPPDGPGMTFSRIQSLFSNEMRVGMTSKIRIYVDDIVDGVGNLTISESFGAQPLVVKEVLKGVNRLQFFYQFDSYHRTNPNTMILPSGSLEKPDASDASYQPGCVPNPALCVNQSDLSSVRVALSSRRPVDSKKVYSTNERGFSLENGIMSLTKVHFAVPKNYGNKSSQWDQLQSLTCQNPNNRCRGLDECNAYFTSTDVASPKWEGYARHVLHPNPSYYCLCGTVNRPSNIGDIQFKLPETQTGYDAVPFYNPTGFPEASWPVDSTQATFIDLMKTDPTNRVLACSAHFTDYIWAFKNPFHYFFHNGNNWNNDAIEVKYRSNGNGAVVTENDRGNIVWHFEQFKKFNQAYLTGPNAIVDDGLGLSWREHIRCRLGYDGISEAYRQMWGAPAGQPSPANDANGRWTNSYIPLSDSRAPTGSRIARITGKVVRPMEEACICKTQNTEGWYAEWACNHMKSGGGSISTMGDAGCPETWDGELVDASSTPSTITQSISPPAAGGVIDPAQHKKVYKVNAGGANPDFPDGLTNANRALLCECLQNQYDKVNIPVAEGWAVSNYWDFRTPGLLAGDPGLNGGPPTAISLSDPGYQSQYLNEYINQMDANERYPWGGQIPTPALPQTMGPPTVTTPQYSGLVSINAASHTAFFRTNTGAIQSITGSCNPVYGGFMSRVTDPAMVPAANLAEVRSKFALICQSNPVGKPYCTGNALNPDTAYVDRWAAYCNKNAFQENSGFATSARYTGTGIKQTRQYLTGVGPSGAVPEWCGGDPQSGQGGT